MSQKPSIKLQDSDFVKKTQDSPWSASFSAPGQKLDMTEWIKSQQRVMQHLEGQSSSQIYVESRGVYVDEYEVVDHEYGAVKKYVLYEGKYGRKSYEFARKYVVFPNNKNTEATNADSSGVADNIALVVKHITYNVDGITSYLTSRVVNVKSFTHINENVGTRALEAQTIGHREGHAFTEEANSDIEQKLNEYIDSFDESLETAEEKINYVPFSESEINPFEIYKRSATTETLKKQYYVVDVKEGCLEDDYNVYGIEYANPDLSNEEILQRTIEPLSKDHIGRLYFSRELESGNHETQIFFDRSQQDFDPQNYDYDKIGAEDSVISFVGSALNAQSPELMVDIELPHFSGTLSLNEESFIDEPEYNLGFVIHRLELKSGLFDSIDLSGFFPDVQVKLQNSYFELLKGFGSAFYLPDEANCKQVAITSTYDQNHKLIENKYIGNNLTQVVKYNKKGDLARDTAEIHEGHTVTRIPHHQKTYKSQKTPKAIYDENYDSSSVPREIVKSWKFYVVEDLGEGAVGDTIASLYFSISSDSGHNVYCKISLHTNSRYDSQGEFIQGKDFSIIMPYITHKFSVNSISVDGTVGDDNHYDAYDYHNNLIFTEGILPV